MLVSHTVRDHHCNEWSFKTSGGVPPTAVLFPVNNASEVEV